MDNFTTKSFSMQISPKYSFNNIIYSLKFLKILSLCCAKINEKMAKLPTRNNATKQPIKFKISLILSPEYSVSLFK